MPVRTQGCIKSEETKYYSSMNISRSSAVSFDRKKNELRIRSPLAKHNYDYERNTHNEQSVTFIVMLRSLHQILPLKALLVTE